MDRRWKVWSKNELYKSRALLRKKRSGRLPTKNDLPKLEARAREEMEESNRDLGVG